MRRAAFPFLLLAGIIGRPLAGQQPMVPDSGVRVRVSAPGERAAGQLLRLSRDSVFVQAGPGGLPRAWDRGSVVRLEVSRGRRGHFWLGLGAGTVIGLVAGKLAADAFAEDGDPITAGVSGVAIWAGATVAGGVAGALIRTERWLPAAWPEAGGAAAARAPDE